MSNLKYNKETSNLGGINEFKFIYEEELPAPIETIEGLAVNFDMNADFIVPDPILEASSFNETKLGADLFQYEFAAYVAKDELEKLKAALKLDSKKVIAVVKDNNNLSRLLGQKDNGCILKLNANKGKKVGDTNAYELSIEWKSRQRSPFVPNSVAEFDCQVVSTSQHAVQGVPYEITLQVTRTDDDATASGSGTLIVDMGGSTQNHTVFLAPGESVEITSQTVLPKLDDYKISWSGICSGELNLNPLRTLDIETDQTISNFNGIRASTMNPGNVYCYIVELDTFFELTKSQLVTYDFPSGVYNLKLFGDWPNIHGLDLRWNNLKNRFADDNNALARPTNLWIDYNDLKEIEFHTPYLVNLLEYNVFGIGLRGNTQLESLNIEDSVNCIGWKTQMPSTLEYYNIRNSNAREICIFGCTQLESIEGIENAPLTELNANGATIFTFNFSSGDYIATLQKLSLQGTAETHIDLSLFSALEHYNTGRYFRGYNVQQFTPPSEKSNLQKVYLRDNSLTELIVTGYPALNEIDFENAPNLDKLDISDNPILIVGSETRYWWRLLTPSIIDVSNTMINALNYGFYRAITGLSDIDISGTPMVKLGINGGALSQEMIDGVISDCVAGNQNDGILRAEGGTNSAPSSTGEANIDILRTRGWTITVTGGY